MYTYVINAIKKHTQTHPNTAIYKNMYCKELIRKNVMQVVENISCCYFKYIAFVFFVENNF